LINAANAWIQTKKRRAALANTPFSFGKNQKSVLVQFGVQLAPALVARNRVQRAGL
jgi:hypothetical protein